jgi:hypothetical protein
VVMRFVLQRLKFSSRPQSRSITSGLLSGGGSRAGGDGRVQKPRG